MPTPRRRENEVSTVLSIRVHYQILGALAEISPNLPLTTTINQILKAYISNGAQVGKLPILTNEAARVAFKRHQQRFTRQALSEDIRLGAEADFCTRPAWLAPTEEVSAADILRAEEGLKDFIKNGAAPEKPTKEAMNQRAGILYEQQQVRVNPSPSPSHSANPSAGATLGLGVRANPLPVAPAQGEGTSEGEGAMPVTADVAAYIEWKRQHNGDIPDPSKAVNAFLQGDPFDAFSQPDGHAGMPPLAEFNTLAKVIPNREKWLTENPENHPAYQRKTEELNNHRARYAELQALLTPASPLEDNQKA